MRHNTATLCLSSLLHELLWDLPRCHMLHFSRWIYWQDTLACRATTMSRYCQHDNKIWAMDLRDNRGSIFVASAWKQYRFLLLLVWGRGTTTRHGQFICCYSGQIWLFNQRLHRSLCLELDPKSKQVQLKEASKGQLPGLRLLYILVLNLIAPGFNAAHIPAQLQSQPYLCNKWFNTHHATIGLR